MRRLYDHVSQVRKPVVHWLRYIRLLAVEFRASLVIFFGVWWFSALILWLWYEHPDTGRGLGFWEALYDVFMMLPAQTPIPPPDSLLLHLVFYAVPMVGLIIVAEGIVRFGVVLFNRKLRLQEWTMVECASLSDHIILCGAGKVGYRVTLELLRLGERVVIVEKAATAIFLDELRDLGVPVLIADARFRKTLEHANIARAKALIATTNDDLVNLEAALGARELNPKVRVVLRLFDDTLAKKIEGAFGIPAISTSNVASGSFVAAATNRGVFHSFRVDEHDLHLADLTIAEGCCLVGQSIGQITRAIDFTVVLYKDSKVFDLHPNPELVLKAGDKVIVLASLEKLSQLEKMNKKA